VGIALLPISATARAWNHLSRSYQRYTRISTDDVHYGSLSPGERELKLLGNVQGKRVLELGCGGGQNSVVLAKWGARPTGIDLSRAQIRFAQALAAREGVVVDFQVRPIEDLAALPTGSYDLVLSSFALEFVEDLGGVCREVARLLVPGGGFVLANLHPIAGAGLVASRGSHREFVMTDYFRRRQQRWRWPRYRDGTTAMVQTYHRTVEDYFVALTAAGFTVTHLVEPAPYPRARWARTGMPCYAPALAREYSIWRRIPYTIIVRGEKPTTIRRRSSR
jgi:2-polyprenyl-3-methyl-5-hydroxy-6-metoxy-1,4-benzoquinol methylase